MRKVRLAVHLPLAYRCHEDFAAMSAVAGGRACGACERVVHDLSAMTEREAARFMSERRGERACIRYVARADGTVVYRAEPRRGGAAVVAAALAACTPWQPTPELRDEVEVVPAEVPVPATVVVPAARVEPPDDDIHPCPPPLVDEPEGKKTKPKKQRPDPRRSVEYLGLDG